MKYVQYYRVSTKRQGESGLGLESQKAILNHYINPENVVAEFTDIESGAASDRKGLDAALEMCVKNNYTLAVAKVDRLSRDTRFTLEVYEKLNGRLFFADLPITNDDPSAFKMLLTFHSAIAERERQLIKIRTKHALEAKRQRGEPMGTARNMTKSGREKAWKKRREIGNKNPNNVKLLNYVKRLREDGMSLTAIAKQLNNEGHTTPSSRSYTKFYPNTVKRIYDRASRLEMSV